MQQFHYNIGIKYLTYDSCNTYFFKTYFVEGRIRLTFYQFIAEIPKLSKTIFPVRLLIRAENKSYKKRKLKKV